MSANQWNNNPAINPQGFMQQQGNGMGYFNPNFYPRQEVIQVNGEAGADAFQMGPNSSVLLLDKTAPIIWFVTTDGAGYKAKTPYDITPHLATPPIDVNSLEERISHLEEIINERKSNDRAAKPKKQSKNESADRAD